MDIAIRGYFEFLFPLLLITWAILWITSFTKALDFMGKIGKPVVIASSVFITLYPFTGLSLAEYLLSLNPNYSIGSIVFFLIIIWKEFGRKPLLSYENLLQFSIWNVGISLCLFTTYLGFVDFDLYAMGYGFSFWFVVTALLTIILTLLRNPLSFIFIFYIVSFDLKLLYSNNFFDYITDGVLFLISLGIVVFSIVKDLILKYRKNYA
jgi:hypothetical protein